MRSSGVDDSKLFFNQVKQKEVIVNGSVGKVGVRNLVGVVTETSPSFFTVRTRDGDVSFDFSKAKIKRADTGAEEGPSANEWAVSLPNGSVVFVKRR